MVPDCGTACRRTSGPQRQLIFLKRGSRRIFLIRLLINFLLFISLYALNTLIFIYLFIMYLFNIYFLMFYSHCGHFSLFLLSQFLDFPFLPYSVLRFSLFTLFYCFSSSVSPWGAAILGVGSGPPLGVLSCPGFEGTMWQRSWGSWTVTPLSVAGPQR